MAELEHRQWSYWTGNFLKQVEEGRLPDIGKWKKEISTPYSRLTEKEKELDRRWARKVLVIIRSHTTKRRRAQKPRK